MYSAEQRKLAIETYIKFDLSAADTVAELGYPTRHARGTAIPRMRRTCRTGRPGRNGMRTGSADGRTASALLASG